MDHTTAARTMAVEKYLLGEFDSEEQDAFEEHFFSCDDCAQEIKAGAALMKHGKEIFTREQTAEKAVVGVGPPKREWFAWLRPAFAVPALAFMLGIVVFQNLVQVPALHQSLVALNAPAVLPNADLHSGSARGDDHVVVAKPGELFQLTIDIPDTSNVAHMAEMYDASGRKLWSLPIRADAPKDGLSLKMPGDLQSGSYSLVVRQVGAAESSEVAHYGFDLKRQ